MYVWYARISRGSGVEAKLVHKVNEGRPHVVDVILSGEIQMVINTTVGRQAIADSRDIRRSAFLHNIPYQTTIPGAWAVVQAIQAAKKTPNHRFVLYKNSTGVR